MSRRAIFWWVVAALFSALNLFFTVYAALRGEAIHAAIHAALVVLVAIIVRRVAVRRQASYGTAARSG